MGNSGDGVLSHGSFTTIGGTDPRARNIISDNFGSGVNLGFDADHSLVVGNYIGTDITGELRYGSRGIILGNSGDGVRSDAPSTTIGGTDPGARNIISNNIGSGVNLSLEAAGPLVQGNIIGLDVNGATFLGNLGDGVVSDGPSTTIGGTDPRARNIISGNFKSGVNLGFDADHSLVVGNYIGTDITGEHSSGSLGNSGDGVLSYAQFTTIGGTDPRARNIISGNFGSGVSFGFGANNSLVQGNFIGTDVTGEFSSVSLSNSGDGVLVLAANDVMIGGTDPGARNVISGNHTDGVDFGIDSLRGRLEGNLIGLDVYGTKPLGNLGDGVLSNGTDTTIGGTDPRARNIIAANSGDGVAIESNASGNLVAANFIGIDATGSTAQGNRRDGIRIEDASDNTIGGINDLNPDGTIHVLRGNVIAGNLLNGIEIRLPQATGNQVVGNLIGTDQNGTGAAGNLGDGVIITTAPLNTIGGATPGARNVISGNGGNGVTVSNATGVVILGNFIGTDAAGTQPVPNAADGILLDSSPSNVVGGPAPGAGNLISGNGVAGVEVRKVSAQGNVIQGNTIGPDLAGEAFLGGAEGLSNLVGVDINGAMRSAQHDCRQPDLGEQPARRHRYRHPDPRRPGIG